MQSLAACQPRPRRIATASPPTCVRFPEGRRVFPTMTVMENLQVGAHALEIDAEVQAGLEIVLRHFPILNECAAVACFAIGPIKASFRRRVGCRISIIR